MNNRQAVKAANRRRQCWPDKQPDHPGVDHCSMWFDGDWAHLCKLHDLRYAKGGSYQDRLHADRELRDGVAKSGPEWWRKPNAWLMYAGVRVFGSKYVPAKWRWTVGQPGGWDWSYYRSLLDRIGRG